MFKLGCLTLYNIKILIYSNESINLYTINILTGKE